MLTKMRFLLKILCFFIPLSLALGQTDSTLKKILISEIQFGENVKGLSPLKVEAAMNLAARFAGNFQIIPFDTRDSIAKALTNRNIKPTTVNIGKELKADLALIIKINRFANLLRVDFAGYNFLDSSVRTSTGYSTIRYYQKEKDVPLLDPALLSACQRAFALLIDKPDVYRKLEGSFNVKPAPTLTIGSINYIEDDSTAKWVIFKDKQLSSFFAIETIFEVARQSQDFVVLDNATRDSIYAFFNLYEPENYNIPTPEEIRALINFEIEYYIAGELKRIENQVVLSLFLCKITLEGLEITDEVQTPVEEDSIEKYKAALVSASKKLFKMKEE